MIIYKLVVTTVQLCIGAGALHLAVLTSRGQDSITTNASAEEFIDIYIVTKSDITDLVQ